MQELREQEAESSAPGIREADPRWLLAKRVAKSDTFARSDRLPRLLLYVCRMYLDGRGAEVNEHRIGIEVFRRAPSYDAGADSIVRSHATRLRQRLELYFATEGASETMRLEVPRGGYVPRFFPVVEEQSGTSEAESIATGVEPQSEGTSLPTEGHPNAVLLEAISKEGIGGRAGWIMPFAAGLLVAIGILTVVLHLRHDAVALAARDSTHNQTAVERRFWATLFSPARRTLIVSGDSGLVLYETYAHHEVMLSDYIDGKYLRAGQGAAVADSETRLEEDLASRRYTSMADLDLVTKLSHLPQWSSEGAQTVFARDLRPAVVEKSNLILLGSRQANPWVSLFEPAMNFILTQGPEGHFYFTNRNPAPGEQEKYIPSGRGGGTGASSVYGLISYQAHDSGAGKVLMLSGLWMSGTESSGNFIFNDEQFSNFLASIEQSNGSIPSFELLIQTRNLGGNAMTSMIVAKRIQRGDKDQIVSDR